MLSSQQEIKKNYLTIQRDMRARKHCPGYKKLREKKYFHVCGALIKVPPFHQFLL